MTNYNKILEAVNRGIKFALSDLENGENLSSVSKQKTGQIVNNNSTKALLELKKNVIDLGLPSGTLWCKYNLGVNPNQLSKPEDWYGGYYAWGELEGNKSIYDWDHYKFAWHGKSTYLTKYITNEKYMHYMSVFDNLTQLQNEDDAAYQNKKLYNFKFHIPTKEQFEELINYTKSYWVNNYDPNKTIHNQKDDRGINGLNGKVFIGQNGNQLFIPAAGYYGHNIQIQSVGYFCALWSSSLFLSSPCNAYYLYTNYLDDIDIYNDQRCEGYSIRPVINL